MINSRIKTMSSRVDYYEVRELLTTNKLHWLANTVPSHENPYFLLCKSRRTGRVYLHVVTLDHCYGLSWWTGCLPDDTDLSIFNEPLLWRDLYRLMGKPSVASSRCMYLEDIYKRASGIVKSNTMIGFHLPT